MVKEITAWEDSKGGVHSTRLSAAKADARFQLERILGKENQAFVNAIMDNANEVHAALADYTHELAREEAKQLVDKEIARANTQ